MVGPADRANRASRHRSGRLPTRPAQDCPWPRHRCARSGAGPWIAGRLRLDRRNRSAVTLDDRGRYFEDRPGDLDPARAGVRAVEDRAAAPHAVLVGQDLEALVRALVARVEDEAVGLDDRGRTDVVRLGPERRAGRRAGGAQDAFRGVVVAGPLLRRLAPL